MLHLTKKDFRIEWYSGSGSGGQHRNKHQNCCRIVHIESGLKSHGTGSKERIANQREAFNNLAQKLIKAARDKPIKEVNPKVIRNYNEFRNEVHDKASGFKQPYSVAINDIGPMIEHRHEAMILSQIQDR
jgi:protein subunit release factor B